MRYEASSPSLDFWISQTPRLCTNAAITRLRNLLPPSGECDNGAAPPSPFPASNSLAPLSPTFAVLRYSLLIVALLTCSGCAYDARWRANHPLRHKSDVQLASFPAESSDQVARSIYVMSNGFHTGLVFNRYDIPEEAWPEIRQIPDHDWVEVGWESEIFYRAKKINAPVVLEAVVPNPSVLHVVGFDRNPEELYAGMDLIRIELN